MKFRCIKKASYVGLSVGIAALIIFTALPYYLQTSIVLPGWNIYWSYAAVQEKMMCLFPGMAFWGAITTLGKRNTMEDVFLNVAAPLTVLLAIRCLQYHLVLVIAILLLSVVRVLFKIINTRKKEKYQTYNLVKKIQVIYYLTRKKGLFLLFMLLTPLTVWTSHNEYYDSDDYLRLWELLSETDETSEEDPVWNVVSESQWSSLAVNTRFEEFEKMVTYFLQDQGCGDVAVYACKELTDGTLAYYSNASESISVNVIYLNTCSYQEAIHVAAHECQHKQQWEVIRAVNALEESGKSYENNVYFKEAYALKEASENYRIDSISYEKYKDNLLEVKSEEYADEMETRLREEGYLK